MEFIGGCNLLGADRKVEHVLWRIFNGGIWSPIRLFLILS